MKKTITVFISSLALILACAGCSYESWSASKARMESMESADNAMTSVQTEAQTEPEPKSEFIVGETWTVDGQWSLTVNSIEEIADRNEFSDKTPASVYIVSFTYQNIGYEDDFMTGLYFSMDDMIVDNEGVMGYTYPNEYTYPQQTPVGATCNAQACIGVDHPGAVKIMISKYDGTGAKHQATFTLQP